jgi:hypothetical protein
MAIKLSLRMTRIACAVLGCLLAWQCAAAAADAKPAAQPKTAPVTNAPPEVKVEIPLSYFSNVPANVAARDPFFPNSDRRRPKAPVQANSPEKPSGNSAVSKLVCKGILGSGENAIAMIGGIGSGIRSFTANETKTYDLPNGDSISVHCTEINAREKYAIVVVGKEVKPQVLYIRPPRGK